MREEYVQANGLRFHLLRWGSSRRGDVLLIHGLASNARFWELAAPRLAEGGLSCLAPDLRGHGLSEKPPAGYNFATIAADLQALVAELGLERPVLVGHSWGAVLALDYAARFVRGPEAPAGIVLVDGGIAQLDDFPGATWEVIRQVLEPPRLAGVRVEDLLARLQNPARAWVPDERAREIILANFELHQDGTLAPHMTYERHMQVVRALWEFKTHERFQRVGCPVLMVPARPPDPLPVDQQAYLVMKERGIARAREVIADLQVHWMEASVHDIPLQRPRELADLILAFARPLVADLRSSA